MTDDNFGAPGHMQDGVESGPQESGPANLEEAFKRLRESNHETPSTNVEGEVLGQNQEEDPRGAAGDSGQAGMDGAVQQPAQEDPQGYQGQGQAPAADAFGDNGAGAGGSAISDDPDSGGAGQSYDAVDYQGIQQQIMKSVTQQAAIAANRLFEQNGISQASLNDLYQRDERGRVTFTNPDDPDRPFASRYEAQQWVDSYNAQVKEEWNKAAREYQQQFAKDTLPAMRLMQFAPKYDLMDEAQRDVFEEIIAPYEIKDKAGMTVGFSCDLDDAAARAAKISAKFSARQAGVPAAASAPATGPAMDMKTSGTGNPQNAKEEPKNLADAFKILNDQKKKGNK